MLLLLVCLFCLAGWTWLLVRNAPITHGGRVSAGFWRTPDAIFAAGLSLLFIFLIAASAAGGSHTLTHDGIKGALFVDAVLLFGTAAFVVLRRIRLHRLLDMLETHPGRGLHLAAASTAMVLKRAFGFFPPQPARVIGLGILCIVLTYPLVLGMQQVVSWFGQSASDGDEMVHYLQGGLSTADKVWAVFMAVVAAPLTEEFVFRGFLYGVLKKYAGSLGAMSACALLFAGIHVNLPAIPALFTLAVCFTLAYEITGSLWTSIVMHMIFNLVPVILILWFPEWTSKL
jgi:membrane protease YdiL (CAAX protease family)